MKQNLLLMLIIVTAVYLALLMVPAHSKAKIAFYNSQGTANIAHRLGHALMPANTVGAGLNALDMGADILEIDLQFTADNHLVVRHDEIIDTTTDGVGLISTMTLDEIEQFDAKFHEIEYPDELGPPGLKIPSLTTLFQSIPQARFLIELKPDDSRAVARLCEVITEHAMTEQVLVGSFHTSVLKNFRRTCPAVPTSHGQTEVLFFYILAKLGLGHLYDPPGYSMQLPQTYLGVEVLSAKMLDVAHQLNLKIEVWTVNDSQSMQKLLAMGVDGIITDRPVLLSDFIYL
jgi:glycerophosphoryl diester phosphodiesterase